MPQLLMPSHQVPAKSCPLLLPLVATRILPIPDQSVVKVQQRNMDAGASVLSRCHNNSSWPGSTIRNPYWRQYPSRSTSPWRRRRTIEGIPRIPPTTTGCPCRIRILTIPQCQLHLQRAPWYQDLCNPRWCIHRFPHSPLDPLRVYWIGPLISSIAHPLRWAPKG